MLGFLCRFHAFIFTVKATDIAGILLQFLAFVLPITASNNVFLTSYWLLKAFGMWRSCIYFDIILLLIVSGPSTMATLPLSVLSPTISMVARFYIKHKVRQIHCVK